MSSPAWTNTNSNYARRFPIGWAAPKARFHSFWVGAYDWRMPESVYVDSLAALLLVSALGHFLLPSQVAKWLSNPALIRLVGAFLLLLALPCLCWRGWYFWTLFGALAISGFWRLFFPHHSIHAQEATYPRRVHGCLLFGGAFAVWALRP